MQLLAAEPSNDRNSRAIYWPGGYGELRAFGELGGGTVTLYEAPLWIGDSNCDEAAQYREHEASVDGTTMSNAFQAGEGYLYVGFAGGNGSDNFTCGIDYQGFKNQIPKFVTDEAVA